MSRLASLGAALQSIGPAILVAAVVCGPGSMLMSSKTGAIFGYDMIWVVVLAAALMWGMVVLSARLGVVYAGTPLEELARRLGRGVAALVGLCLFLVVAGFQISNNVAIVAALEPILPPLEAGGSGLAIRVAVLAGLNLFALAVVYGSSSLYRPIERLMKTLVLLVVCCFLVNFFLARPDPLAMLRGLVPTPPPGGFAALISPRADPSVTILQALVATTFSVAGAFYQAYAVRARGWGLADVRRGMIDSLVGVAVLGGVSVILMSTAAAALHGSGGDPAALGSVADVARQLEPLFGRYATLVFSTGVFAGAFGAFIVNAIIGGNMLADGFGWGSTMNDRAVRHSTAAALGIGFVVASGCLAADIKPVVAITVAQASTVLGLPALALALVFLATRSELKDARRVPRWMIALGCAGILLTLLLAARTVGLLLPRLG